MQINCLRMETPSLMLNLRVFPSSSGVSVLLLFRIISLGFLSLNLLHSTSWQLVDGIQTNNVNNNNNNPLIYTKLRHDLNYLQLYRNYQLEHPHEEKEIQLRVNETIKDELGLPQTTEVVYTYYKNKQVDANKVTRDDLILEALDRTYKTRLLPAYLYNYDNPEDRVRASDPKLIDDDKCKRHLHYLRSKLQSLIEKPNLEPISPELAAFFDSYASEEPGLLFGNYHWTGNWRQCYKRQIFDISTVSTAQQQGNNLDGVTNFKGRYCIASIRSQNWEQKIKIKRDELLKSGNHFKYPEQPHDYERFFRIQLGICLPESCDSRAIDTEVDLIRELVVHKLQEPLRSYKLVDLYCLPDETSELRQFEPNASLLILLAIVWCVAIVSATLYDLMRTNSGVVVAPSSILDKLVSALSLLRNYHRLIETKSLMNPSQQLPKQHEANSGNVSSEKTRQTGSDAVKLSPNDLLFLNAFKVISMPCILFGHTGMLSIMLNRFPLDYEALENDYLNHFNISSVFFVDWYFVITGFLASYLAFVTRKVERNCNPS